MSETPTIDSLASWHDAVRWGLGHAQAAEARTITCIDPSFESWPLGDAELLQGLANWLRRPGRRLLMLAASYDEVPRCHPRFVQWRRDWAHAMQTLRVPAELAIDLPSLLLDDLAVSVQLIDPEHWRGRASLDKRTRWLWQEKTDVVLQRSEPAFAVTTLGL
jgi:hypothetical protein